MPRLKNKDIQASCPLIEPNVVQLNVGIQTAPAKPDPWFLQDKMEK